jgi:DNA polymerase-3 subunit gamma/tau
VLQKAKFVLMSDYVVSARKYRPNTFETIVGQVSITSTLRNAIKNDHVAQAFLFCGTRGVGKTTCARILAKTINCFNPTEKIEACDTCESCESFNSGASLNVYELDAASNNGVDEIRSLIDQVRIAPQLGSHKVYIIDEVHMLSKPAFNAFLKTLEEPPKHAIFILATTEKHKIIPTILSRCQIFDFNRIKVKDIADHLANIATKEGITADKNALHIIAQKADGALRDALSIFDQIVSFSGDEITYEGVIENLNILDYDYYFKIIDTTLEEDIPGVLLLLNEILGKGFDSHNFLVGLANHCRDLLVCKDVRTAPLLEVSESVQQKYISQAKSIEGNNLIRALGVLSSADVQYKASKNQRLLVEMALMQLCSLNQELDKKKNLTDPVEIIPFSNIKLRKKGPKIKIKPEIGNQIESEQHKPRPIKVTKASRKIKTSNLSIKKLIEKKEEIAAQGIVDSNSMPQDSYSIDDLKMYWRRFAFEMKSKGKETFYNAMIKRDPKHQEINEFALLVDNQIQIDYIKPQLSELVDYMRTELNNYQIEIKIELTNKPEEQLKFQTGKDKFAALARKNPNLHALKSTFNLDIEY